MAKKKVKTKLKDPVIHNEKPVSTDGLKKLKVGQEVMYRTPYLFDKCTVIEVDKTESIAILSNQVKVSRGILPNNHLLKIGSTTESTEIMLWSEECQLKYDAFISKRNLKNFVKELDKYLDSSHEPSIIIELSHKIDKVKTKYMNL